MPRTFSHSEFREIQSDTTDYYLISHFTDGTFIKRRYNDQDFLADVAEVFIPSPEQDEETN